jgi:deazaflavin-dependent oxidoreductase (nitroreductase family)
MVTESTGRRERLSTDSEASEGGVMTTETTETMAVERERQARRMRRINVPMRAVLGLPFKTPLSTRLMLVFYTGRKTGRKYRQPVSYVRDGDTLLTPGGGKWKLNLRDGEPVRLRLAGRKVLARPQLVRDAAEVDRLLRHMMAHNPRLSSFVPFIERDGSIARDKLATALSHGFCVVRWHLDGTQP